MVSADHRRWWSRELVRLPPDNVIVQPANRGTAAGLLLPYMHVLHRDPDPRILVLSSDHVADENALAQALHIATGVAADAPDRAVLLGMVPEKMNEEYGWIVASSAHGGGPVRTVWAFLEKPDPEIAAYLASNGGLINSMILVADHGALTRMFERTLPGLLLVPPVKDAHWVDLGTPGRLRRFVEEVSPPATVAHVQGAMAHGPGS